MRYRIGLILLIVVLGLGAVFARPGALDMAARGTVAAQFAGRDLSAAERGAVTFAYGDWGALSSDTLRTSGAPWKLTTAALALRAAGGDAVAAGEMEIAEIYRPFGFLSPGEIANWPEGLAQPVADHPLGLTTGTARKGLPPLQVSIANMGCAACHAGPVYDETGAPQTDRVWLGTPNGSINLEAYTGAIYDALLAHGTDPRLWDVAWRLFPDTPLRERVTLRYGIAPVLRGEIAARAETMGRLLPFRGSLAGATNGLDSLRHRLGLIPEGEVAAQSVFNSVPDLGGRLWRDSLLNTGTYATATPDQPMARGDLDAAHRAELAAIIAYFTVPSMGVTEDVAAAHIPDAVQVTDWMETYEPQPYPGVIDRAKLAEGRAVYARACSACHGSYDDSLSAPRLTGFPNWIGDVGTDPERAALTGAEIAGAVNDGPYRDHITARAATGYAAPPLTGLWSSAPYLHNGSVPTLWHLMRPETRPAQFEVGGHRIDLERVGIELSPPEDHVPWSIPAQVDTGAFGLSSGGHEVGFEGLSEAEKDALLEYLKLL